ncbi:glycosyl transferase [Cryobacterium flavum]|uniref:Glycosyl transferase n=1 Tax=Cryobacterium flavum TaxID=1424659 RepID=A0ABY2I6S1_9MICO|nr:glycosyl transferase [Cryobacterium flavum]TFB78575.1 glycosyl transferase [Cryobacterium flavum]
MVVTRLTVLQSFPTPRPTTNPYLSMLGNALRDAPEVTVLNFRWRTALGARFDVFHVHWPEILVTGRTPARQLARQALTLALVCRLRLTRTPIVRTMHNLHRPVGLSRRQEVLLTLLDRQTALRIRLNETTAGATGLRATTIRHGHYLSWYANHPRAPMVEGRIGFAGWIRRYKGVEDLVKAFRQTDAISHGLTLRIGGLPSSAELARQVTALAAGDPRITIDLRFLEDRKFVDLVTSAELVVLPYRFMHNSGGALAALSLGRAILVPDNATNQRLAAEVGPGWVYRYSGAISATAIVETMALMHANTVREPPNLNARDWARAGIEHVEAYRLAVAMANPT